MVSQLPQASSEPSYSFSNWITKQVPGNTRRHTIHQMNFFIGRLKLERRIVPFLALSAFTIDFGGLIAVNYYLSLDVSASLRSRACLLNMTLPEHPNDEVSVFYDDLGNIQVPADCMSWETIYVQFYVLLFFAGFCMKTAYARRSFSVAKQFLKMQRRVQEFRVENLSVLDELAFGQIDYDAINKVVHLRKALATFDPNSRRGDDYTLHHWIRKGNGSIVRGSELYLSWLDFRLAADLNEHQMNIVRGEGEIPRVSHADKLSEFMEITNNLNVCKHSRSFVHYCSFLENKVSLDKLADKISKEQWRIFCLEYLERMRMFTHGYQHRLNFLVRNTLVVDGRVTEDGESSDVSVNRVCEMLRDAARLAEQFPITCRVIIWDPSPFIEEILSKIELGDMVIQTNDLQILNVHIAKSCIPPCIRGSTQTTIKTDHKWSSGTDKLKFGLLEFTTHETSELFCFGEDIRSVDIAAVEDVKLLVYWYLCFKVFKKPTHFDLTQTINGIWERAEASSACNIKSAMMFCESKCLEMRNIAKKTRKAVYAYYWLSSQHMYRIMETFSFDVVESVMRILEILALRMENGIENTFARAVRASKLPLKQTWDKLKTGIDLPVFNPVLAVDIPNRKVISLAWSYKTHSDSENYEGMSAMIEYTAMIIHDLSMRYSQFFHGVFVIDFKDKVPDAEFWLLLRDCIERYPNMFELPILAINTKNHRNQSFSAVVSALLFTLDQTEGVSDQESKELVEFFFLRSKDEMDNLHQKHVSPSCLPKLYGGTNGDTSTSEELITKELPQHLELIEQLVKAAGPLVCSRRTSLHPIKTTPFSRERDPEPKALGKTQPLTRFFTKLFNYAPNQDTKQVAPGYKFSLNNPRFSEHPSKRKGLSEKQTLNE
mmetsp:Transcript_23892/g.38111  ORF Transcript_23892/g.38111 Transcript_23892/m.38111 type:complete len:885 (+) Transcript_23892:1732-4386(+)